MSDIVKLASRYGVEDLLPVWQGVKLFHQEKYDKKQFMKGVLWPKLHKHEREPRVIKTNEEIDSILKKARGSRQVKKNKSIKTWV